MARLDPERSGSRTDLDIWHGPSRSEALGHDPYAALRLGDYRRFLLAMMVFTIGKQMQGVAVGWELYRRTGSAWALGLVGLVQFVPVLLLALPAGHAADRHGSKRQLLAAQGLRALASLGLAALSAARGPVPLVYGCLLLTGTAHAVLMPARWALLPQLVPVELLAGAVTWNSGGWQVAAMVGPALGGLVIARTGGAMWAYLLDAIGSALIIVLILPIRVAPTPRASEPVTLGALLAGISFVWRTELILATITLDLFAVLLGGATALLPIFAEDILRVGPVGLGWLRAAPSIGASLMAMTLAHRPPLRHAGPTLLWAVAGFGAATIVFGLSRDARLSFAMLLLTGALDNISVVVRATLVQLLTPDSMRGRVSAVNAIFIGSSNELGGFESGLTAQLVGPVVSVVAGGIGTILVVLAVALIWPPVRRLGSLHQAGRPEGAGTGGS
ncbi:MAG: MFS transporter [Singulisphaera sp.]|nr:MFS transporter [Singulisphaera sp.]